MKYKSNIIICPKCKMRVLPDEDGTCPICNSIISKKKALPSSPSQQLTPSSPLPTMVYLIEGVIWIALSVFASFFSTSTEPIFLFPISVYCGFLIMKWTLKNMGRLAVTLFGGVLIGWIMLALGSMVRALAFGLFRLSQRGKGSS